MKSLFFPIFLSLVLSYSAYSATNSTITGPSINVAYKMNQTYTFIGIALDQNGQRVKKADFKWTVHLKHDNHWHDNMYATNGDSIFEFSTPVKGELTSIYRFKIDMTTPYSTGKDSTIYTIMYPDTSLITFSTTPVGINIKVFATAFTSNFTFAEVEGGILPIVFDTNQTINGEKYRFKQWSFGSTNSSQVFYVPSNDTTFSIIFEKVGGVSAVNNESLTRINIFPNPFHEEFTVEGLEPGDEVYVYDPFMNQITVGSILKESSNQKINLKGSGGVYFLKVISKNKTSHFFKLVKN